VQVNVPNDPKYIAAFWGALLELSHWWNWERDDARTARVAALRCFNMWLAARANRCGAIGVDDSMQWRQDGCKFQYSVDCVNWITIYDPSQCIDDAISGGSGGGGELGEGECITYKRRTDAAGTFIVPTLVKAGYVIDIIKCEGAAGDGFSPLWRCPDGNVYHLTCQPDTATLSTDDPGFDDGFYHLAYIARIGDQLFPAWQGQGFTVPDTIPNLTVMEMFRNDNTLSDNTGDTYVELSICRPSGVGSGSGVELVQSGDIPIEITDLGGLSWHVHAEYNNSPVSETEPRTVVQCRLEDGNGDPYITHMVMSNLTITGQAPAYTNNGGISKGTFGGDYVGAPELGDGHTYAGYEDWFNAQNDAENWALIDCRGLEAIDFDLTASAL
jgi:hypothetical protein